MKDTTALYQALINGASEFTISSEDLNVMDVADLGVDGMHVIRNTKGYRVRVVSADYVSKTFVLRIGHQDLRVQLKDTVELQVESMGFERNSSKHINEITAPMPGLVLDIRVQAGDAVEADDPLVILEAMKMENVLSAPRKAVISSISVAKGDTVDKSQILVTLE